LNGFAKLSFPSILFTKLHRSGALNLATLTSAWHGSRMRQRFAKRWFFALGMLAMLGMLLAVPVSSNAALAMSAQAVSADAASEMPCHEPAKPCPECPPKGCPGTAACLAKCASAMPSLVSDHVLDAETQPGAIPPGFARVAKTLTTPPLLRPPSV
jgi:hypothetical protein